MGDDPVRRWWVGVALDGRRYRILIEANSAREAAESVMAAWGSQSDGLTEYTTGAGPLLVRWSKVASFEAARVERA